MGESRGLASVGFGSGGSLRGAGVTGCDAFGDVQELFAECCFYVGGGSGVGSWDETKLSPVSFGG